MSDQIPENMREPKPLFEARLRPRRSLSPRGFALLTWAMALIGFAHGAAFLAIGAWPIVGFMGVEWLLFWWLFRRHFLGDRRGERLRLYPDRLILETSDSRGVINAMEWQPYWLRVDLAKRPPMGNALYLTSHGRGIEIGRFLGPEERRQLAETLRAELARCRLAVSAVRG